MSINDANALIIRIQDKAEELVYDNYTVIGYEPEKCEGLEAVIKNHHIEYMEEAITDELIEVAVDSLISKSKIK